MNPPPDAPAELIAAGWQPTPDGHWKSPLTQRVYDTEGALRMQRLSGARRMRRFRKRASNERVDDINPWR